MVIEWSSCAVQNTWTLHADATFFFLVGVVLWLIHLLNFGVEVYKHRAQFVEHAEFALGDLGARHMGHVCLNNYIEHSYWRTFFYQPHEFHEEDGAAKKTAGDNEPAPAEGAIPSGAQRDMILEHRRHILNVSLP